MFMWIIYISPCLFSNRSKVVIENICNFNRIFRCKKFWKITLLLFRWVDISIFLYSWWLYNFLWGSLKWISVFNNLFCTAIDFWRSWVIEGLVLNLSLYFLVFWDGYEYQEESWFCLLRFQGRNWHSLVQL